MMLGLVHHQVAVESASFTVDERRDRPEDDRSGGDRLDEVRVPDVEVEDARPCAEQDLDLVAEPCEVGCVQRGLYLDRSDPAVPAHRTILGRCKRGLLPASVRGTASRRLRDDSSTRSAWHCSWNGSGTMSPQGVTRAGER
jgi:hypothetical protein